MLSQRNNRLFNRQINLVSNQHNQLDSPPVSQLLNLPVFLLSNLQRSLPLSLHFNLRLIQANSQHCNRHFNLLASHLLFLPFSPNPVLPLNPIVVPRHTPLVSLPFLPQWSQQIFLLGCHLLHHHCNH